MRTKTLLLTAAIGAAGLASASADVFSVNAVGFVNITAPKGFSMIANPLDNKAGNDLNHVLPTVPDGTTIYKFNGATYDLSTYLGGWDPNLSMAPGEGAFVFCDNATPMTFVGDVMQGTQAAPLKINIPKGFSIRSMMVPQSIALDDPSVGFPAADGDTVYFFRGGTYVLSTFLGGFDPAAVPALGESFFVFKDAAADWNRVFSVNN